MKKFYKVTITNDLIVYYIAKNMRDIVENLYRKGIADCEIKNIYQYSKAPRDFEIRNCAREI